MVADPVTVSSSALSVAELAELTTGADLWCTRAAPPLGLPALRTSDGPNGVRGSRFDERLSAWCTPCGAGLAATWDEDLVRAVGALLGDEARRTGVDILLAPTVNLPRSPLGGRGFESYSEDPLLSGRLAAAYVTGVQSRGVAAAVKHFVANDAERKRTTVNCVVDERALREIYLLPFEHAVRAGVWALMTSYNKVNGTYASQHRHLIREVLKEEWGFDGLVLSDWNSLHDTVGCALAGLDLEMPVGPVMGRALAEAVTAGAVPQELLVDKVERMHRLARRVLDHPARQEAEEGVPGDDGARRQGQAQLLVEAAASSFVLLKNDADLLPLHVTKGGGPLAVIGPNATDACYQGGGSAWVNTGPLSTPLDGLIETYAAVTDVRHEPGSNPRTSFRPLETLAVRSSPAGTEPGLVVTYRSDQEAGPPVVEIRRGSFLSWHDGIDTLAAGEGTVSMTTWLTPTRGGDHVFSVRGSGATQLFIDSAEVASLPPQSDEADIYAAFFSPALGVGRIRLTAGSPVKVEALMRHEPSGIPVFEVGCKQPLGPGARDRAVALARTAQLVVLIVGTSTDDEAESQDRVSTALPGDQDELVEAVLAVNPRTVVVVNAGTAVDLRWAAHASTVLYTWLPGHGFAAALASVLSGRLEPGGRLPLTLAASPADYPAYDTAPDERGDLHYAESVHVGYRHFDAARLEPEFAFGHGLGYTRFGYRRLDVEQIPGRTRRLRATVDVVNEGDRPGKEVVQLYISPPGGRLSRPPRELKAFAAVRLAPGERRTVTLDLDARAFACWDPTAHQWWVAAGQYGIHVGRSSRDLRLDTTVLLPESHIVTSGEGAARPGA